MSGTWIRSHRKAPGTLEPFSLLLPPMRQVLRERARDLAGNLGRRLRCVRPSMLATVAVRPNRAWRGSCGSSRTAGIARPPAGSRSSGRGPRFQTSRGSVRSMSPGSFGSLCVRHHALAVARAAPSRRAPRSCSAPEPTVRSRSRRYVRLCRGHRRVPCGRARKIGPCRRSRRCDLPDEQ